MKTQQDLINAWEQYLRSLQPRVTQERDRLTVTTKQAAISVRRAGAVQVRSRVRLR